MTPLKKQDTQVVDSKGYVKFLFLVSLIQLKVGWRANQALQRTAAGAVSSAYAGRVVDPAWLSFCRQASSRYA